MLFIFLAFVFWKRSVISFWQKWKCQQWDNSEIPVILKNEIRSFGPDEVGTMGLMCDRSKQMNKPTNLKQKQKQTKITHGVNF